MQYRSLKHWRQSHGFTQRQAARLLDISHTMYVRLELGYKPATGALAKMLLKETGVPLEVLTGVH